MIDTVNPDDLPGLKQREIQKCALCLQGVGAGHIDFFVVDVRRYVINHGAVQRQHGLEQFMGAAAPLASIMGPDEDMAKQISERSNLWICAECAYGRNSVKLRDVVFLETEDDQEETDDA